MNLIKRYNQIMGPKDERLEAEENKSMKVGGTILLIGSVLSLYYAIMLDQVSSTTGQPIFTALGEKLIPVHLLLVLTILVAGVVSLTMQNKGRLLLQPQTLCRGRSGPMGLRFPLRAFLWCNSWHPYLRHAYRGRGSDRRPRKRSLDGRSCDRHHLLHHGLLGGLCSHHAHHPRCHQAPSRTRERA